MKTLSELVEETLRQRAEEAKLDLAFVQAEAQREAAAVSAFRAAMEADGVSLGDYTITASEQDRPTRMQRTHRYMVRVALSPAAAVAVGFDHELATNNWYLSGPWHPIFGTAHGNYYEDLVDAIMWLVDSHYPALSLTVPGDLDD